MADQLSLRLEADRLPDLPDLRPMLPRPLPEPFDSDEHLFEPWWGGERALVSIGPADAAGDGEVADSRCRRRTTSRRHCPSWPGWPSGSPRARRSSTASWSWSTPPAGPIRPSWRDGWRGEPGRPVAFLAFDLLHLDGRSLLSQPLVRRREALRRVLRPGDEVVAVPAIATEGIALFEAVGRPGHRRASWPASGRARTCPGVRSRLWRFIAATPGPVPGRDGRGRRGDGAGARGRAGPRADQPLAARGLAGDPPDDAQALRAAATKARNPGRCP